MAGRRLGVVALVVGALLVLACGAPAASPTAVAPVPSAQPPPTVVPPTVVPPTAAATSAEAPQRVQSSAMLLAPPPGWEKLTPAERLERALAWPSVSGLVRGATG